jgi:hypothetical protein
MAPFKTAQGISLCVFLTGAIFIWCRVREPDMETQTTPTEEQNTARCSPKEIFEMLHSLIPEQASGWENRGPLPFFRGRSFEEHVNEWRLVDREAQNRKWKLAAIAASLERSSGGRPKGYRKRTQTAIQRFCEAVKIDRQTFHRFSSTYKKISDLASITDVTSFEPDMSFKHYVVAARLAGVDALEAVAQARENRWPANTLQRFLEGQRDKRQKPRRRVSLRQARERIVKMMEGWSEDDRRQAVLMLRGLADDIEREVGPAPSVIDFINRQLHDEIDARDEVEDDDSLDDFFAPGELEPALPHDELDEAPF